jgi:hypothetical protein
MLSVAMLASFDFDVRAVYMNVIPAKLDDSLRESSSTW